MSVQDWGLKSGGIFAGSDDWGGGSAGMFGSIAGADWLSAGSNVLGKALQSPGATSSATAIQRVDAPFDSSNWVVSLGGSRVDATQSNARNDTEGLALPSGNTLLIGVAVIGLALLWKRSRK